MEQGHSPEGRDHRGFEQFRLFPEKLDDKLGRLFGRVSARETSGPDFDDHLEVEGDALVHHLLDGRYQLRRKFLGLEENGRGLGIGSKPRLARSTRL